LAFVAGLATLALGAAAVVGVLGAHALQRFGALCELQLNVADRAVAVRVGVDLRVGDFRRALQVRVGS